MIKISDGNVILEVEGAAFDLSNSSSYSEFLLWITNPDPGVVIRSDSFVVEEILTGEVREKAQRYADFLSEFVERRRVRSSKASCLSMSGDARFKISLVSSRVKF